MTCGKSAVSRIAVRGAAEPPLRGIDVDLPLGQLLAFSGPAGSGARTLAFQVLLAESRRRYVQALSPFEREAMGGGTGGVALESVTGLPPAASLPGPVPSSAAVSAYLHLEAPISRVLRQRGQITCPECGGPCHSWTAEGGARSAVARERGQRVLVVAPLELTASTSPESVAAELRRAGFLRLRAGGEVVRLRDDPGAGSLPPGVGESGHLEVVVDRLTLSESSITRLSEAVRSARAMARGRAALFVGEDPKPIWLNQQITCDSCGRIGADLSERDVLPSGGAAAGHVSIAGRTALEIYSLGLEGAREFWLEALQMGEEGAADDPSSGGSTQAILGPLERGCQLGLGYLPLGARLQSLSRGERLLLSLAAALSRDLSGILYLVSEPVEILDHDGRAKAIAALRALAAAGNTVVVVTSAEETLNASDRVFHFSAGQLLDSAPSRGEDPAPGRGGRRHSGERRFGLRGCGDRGNLGELALDVPLGCLVAFRGPTGAGKSAILEQLLPAVVGSRGRAARPELAHLRVDDGGLRRLVFPGRAVPVDDVSVMDLLALAEHLARVYADTSAAQERGYPTEWFLLDRPGGRCTTCEGRGTLRWDLEFMEVMTLPCPTCQGRRYRPEVLEITQRGMAISDVLELSLDEAAQHFERHRRLGPSLEAAVRLALGHRRLGEGVTRLDAAELLRLTIAASLPRASSKDLFVLAYPAAGQHLTDVRFLLGAIDELLEAGASVWVEEHHPAVIAAASAVVGVGPSRGVSGGLITGVTEAPTGAG